MNKAGIPVAAFLVLASIFVLVFRYKLTDWNDRKSGRNRSSSERAAHANLAFVTAAIGIALALAALFLI